MVDAWVMAGSYNCWCRASDGARLPRLLGACPGGERQELLLKALRVAAPMGDTAGQLARAVVEDDVQRTQVPSLLVPWHGGWPQVLDDGKLVVT